MTKKKAVANEETVNEVSEVVIPLPEAKNVASGKDTTLYELNGKKYTKGRLVLEVVTNYLEKNNVKSIADLQKAFPNELQPRFGVVAEIDVAKEISKKYKRYFLKYGEVKSTKDGKQLAVCNQWGIGNIQPFIEHAIGMGFEIKVI